MAETALARRLRDRIRAHGPIPFHDLMDAALYDPEHGYYARGPAIGKEGDFSTSVSFEAFRDGIVRLVEDARRALGEPPGFRVVELGAGTGQLAAHVTARLPDVAYVTVEASPALRERQAALPRVSTVARAAQLAPAPGLVFGNEVLDALPVRRVTASADGSLLEVVVDVDARGAFRERLAPLRDPLVEARLRREDVWPQRGQLLDVAPALEAFVADAARLAEPGFLVLVDYGDPAPALYAPTRLNGTLAVYHRHAQAADPYDDVGLRDLTADVDFTAVEHAAREAGAEPLGLVPQGAFLGALGVDERDLVSPARLGSAFQVFAARRGTRATLPGFTARTPSP